MCELFDPLSEAISSDQTIERGVAREIRIVLNHGHHTCHYELQKTLTVKEEGEEERNVGIVTVAIHSLRHASQW